MALYLTILILACIKIVVSTDDNHHNTYRTGNFGRSTSKPQEYENFKILKSVSDLSHMQCLHRCNLQVGCNSIGFELYDEEKVGECILLGSKEDDGKSFVSNEHNEGGMQFTDKLSIQPYHSCMEAYTSGERKSSAYFLIDIGWHYCNMGSLGNCGLGGWTLAMNIDGQKETFQYYSAYWTNTATYNTELNLADPFNLEAKYSAFSRVPFTYICLGMRVESSTKYIKFKRPAKSLMNLFRTVNSTNMQKTYAPENDWKNLIPNLNLQSKCLLQGFNIEAKAISVRLGYIANDQGNIWTDTWIGIGGEPTWCTDLQAFSAGNGCCLDALCKNDTHIPVTAYVYIQ